ncbi:MAG: radical SAM protein [Brevinematia bacterium]
MKRFPSYLSAYESGELEKKIKAFEEILSSCTLCPRKCKVNRLKGKKGYCKAGYYPSVSSYFPHFGEEDILVGSKGSGTIFFANCNLGCVYCQNFEISHLGNGKDIDEKRLAEIMIYLERAGCHNINFVTPTHYTPQILKALRIAIEGGFSLPLVYNCGGYESVETLRLLDGIVDIYMPDFKYGDNKIAKLYSNAEDYFEVCLSALKEMQRQTGDLRLDERGLAYRGLLIRHLVLPNHIESSKRVIKAIHNEISKNATVNVMAQYRPLYRAKEFFEIGRSITLAEYDEVREYAEKLGLTLV